MLQSDGREIDGIKQVRSEVLVFERKSPVVLSKSKKRCDPLRNIQNREYLSESIECDDAAEQSQPPRRHLSCVSLLACLQATIIDEPAFGSPDSTFALCGAYIVRRIAVESVIACATRGEFAARGDQAGKADIRSCPDVVQESCSPWPCANGGA